MKIWHPLLCIILLTVSQTALAIADFKKGIVLRDAESETILKSYIEPIFKVAGLNPAQLQFILIYDPELNAFATSRFTIALHTGLIQKSKNVDEVIGVLAH